MSDQANDQVVAAANATIAPPAAAASQSERERILALGFTQEQIEKFGLVAIDEHGVEVAHDAQNCSFKFCKWHENPKTLGKFDRFGTQSEEK